MAVTPRGQLTAQLIHHVTQGVQAVRAHVFLKYCEMEQEHKPKSYANLPLINISATVHALVTHAPVRDQNCAKTEMMKAKGFIRLHAL